MITVYLNDQEKQLAISVSLAQALQQFKVGEGNFAVALNDGFVPKSQYSKTLLEAGDRLELLTPMQGG